MDDLSAKLANAEARVTEARRIVARHQRRVAEQVARGRPIPGADEALELFVGTLKTFEDYERLLHFEAERAASQPNGQSERSEMTRR